MTVQHNSAATETGTSLAVAFKSNITSGHLILVAESSYDGMSLLTPTDTKGNTFTKLVTQVAGSGESVTAIYSASANASGADTVTCGISASNNIHCHVYEVEGVTSTVDQTGTSTVSSTSLTVSTSSSTTNAVDYLLAFFSDNGPSTYAVGSGWGDTEQSIDPGSDGDSAFSEDQIVVAAGAQTATATASVADTFANVIVALKASGTPTASTPTFSPGSGTYISVQTVTISDWTNGASIYYTTDGSTPSTSSTMCNTPVIVSTPETLQAMPRGAVMRAARWARRLISSTCLRMRRPSAPCLGRIPRRRRSPSATEPRTRRSTSPPTTARRRPTRPSIVRLSRCRHGRR